MRLTIHGDGPELDRLRSMLLLTLAMGALKYFLLKVDPKKRMLFNPEESINFQGNTGPFIQYTHARIAASMSVWPVLWNVSTNRSRVPRGMNCVGSLRTPR